MNFDQMLEAWRAQDETPLYGVNRDLLQLVIRLEQADLRRKLRWELWVLSGASVGLMALSALFFASIEDPRTVWDFVATGTALGATLLFAGALWASRKRQALRERGFGNSLQEEIRRNLSLVDYQLSRRGRLASSLLISSPMTAAAILIIWLTFRINDKPFGWSEAWIVLVVVFSWAWGTFWASRRVEKTLLPRRRRLSQLLELLNASE